ncbi:MAG: FkbM family methyltransferase [Candidatus Parvarchaeota archaeon]
MGYVKLVMFFVDVGENNGYFTLLASKLVGDEGKVLSIEANPTAFSGLCRNIELNDIKNVNALNVAVSNYNGVANIYLDLDSEDGLATIVGGYHHNKISEVRCFKISSLLGNMVPNIIKLDIEGSEISVIESLLDDGVKPEYIIMEFNSEYQTKAQFDWLIKNFRIFLLESNSANVQLIPIFEYKDLHLSLANFLLIPIN